MTGVAWWPMANGLQASRETRSIWGGFRPIRDLSSMRFAFCLSLPLLFAMIEQPPASFLCLNRLLASLDVVAWLCGFRRSKVAPRFMMPRAHCITLTLCESELQAISV